MKILLVGAHGQLATSLGRVFAGHDVTALGHGQLDITDEACVSETVSALSPHVVINGAAKRRPDACEEDPEAAFAVNALGPKHLALACARTGSVLVQVSTDTVFDGRKTTPYVEEDPTRPINAYGRSKLAGESFVRELAPKHFIVRTSALFGEGSASGPATNFVLLVLRQAREGKEVRVVTDQVVSPTYTRDAAEKIAWIVEAARPGTYHVANAGSCSWYEFARAIFDKAGVKAKLVPVTTAELKPKAARLPYAALANGALRRLGADDMRPWQAAVEEYLRIL